MPMRPNTPQLCTTVSWNVHSKTTYVKKSTEQNCRPWRWSCVYLVPGLMNLQAVALCAFVDLSLPEWSAGCEFSWKYLKQQKSHLELQGMSLCCRSASSAAASRPRFSTSSLPSLVLTAISNFSLEIPYWAILLKANPIHDVKVHSFHSLVGQPFGMLPGWLRNRITGHLKTKTLQLGNLCRGCSMLIFELCQDWICKFVQVGDVAHVKRQETQATGK